jgi:hypothetical protein
MNNNTETIEQVAESYARAFDNDNWKALQSLILDGINWQKEQDLPIIKELLEELIKANLYVPPKFYGQGESVDNDHYLEIQTTLDKYQNYL